MPHRLTRFPRNRFPILVVSVLAVLSAASAGAGGQTVRRFDMGPASGPVAAGFTAVGTGTLYAAAQGYGWTVPPASTYLAPPPVPEVQTNLDPDLIRDGVSSTSDMSFRVDVSNGTWHCVAYLGDLGAAREGLDILVNGTEVVSDAFARTLTMKAQFTNALGGYRRVRFLATTATGRLGFTFHCNGSGASVNALAGLEVYPHVPVPVGYDHTTRQLAADPAYAVALGPFLAAFNADDYAGAEAALAAVADPLARAWGLAWLAGWLTGEEADVRTDVLQSARALLEGLAAPDNPAVAGLLADIRDLESGWLYTRTRGYTTAAIPTSLSNIIKNLSAGAQLLEQFDGDILQAAPDPDLPESPLFPKARFLLGRNLYGRNTLVNAPANPYTAYWLGLLASFQPHFDLFPNAADAMVFAFLATSYAVPGGISQNWTGPASVPAFSPATTWWSPHTVVPAHPAAPAWANAQRRYLRAFRNAGEWWMTNRLIAGEIGGGDGDDVEGAGLLGLPAVAVGEPGNVLESGVREVMDQVLYGPSVTPAQGYFTACGDVEHAAEFTTNPLYVLLFSEYGKPEYVEYALRTLSNLDDLADPAPWTLPHAGGQRHFRGYNFGSNSVCGAPRDIPLNLRAAVPGFFLGAYNAHPRLVQIFDGLARQWAAAAVSTAQGKPAGVFPTAIDWTTGLPAFGTGGQWWTNGGYYDLPSGTFYHGYLYALLVAAYNHSTAADRHLFLDAIWRGALLLWDYRTGVLTGIAPGQPWWTADVLKGVIADAVAGARALLVGDPVLALGAADVAKINAVIAAYASPWQKYVSLPAAGTKDKTAITTTFGNAAAWVDSFWPLATTGVSYTDRIGIIVQGSQGLLFGAVTGEATWGIVPPSVVSWSNTDPAAGELDFAALVNDVQAAGLDLLLFNHGPGPRSFGVRLWRRFPPGAWEARIGNDANHDDAMDGPPHTVVPFTLDAPGMTVVVPAVPSGVLQKVELRLVTPSGAGAALLPDPALSAGDVAVDPGGTVTVTVHNLGSAPVAGASVELRENGALLASAPLPAIGAPLDWAAHTAVATLGYVPILPQAPLTVRVVPPAGAFQVTSLNDEVTLSPAVPDPVLSISGSTPYATFSVEIAAPFDKGKSVLFAAGISGASPGTAIPGPGALVLPVNWDWVTQFSLVPGNGVFDFPLAVVDAAGHAAMQVTVPDLPSVHGLTLAFGAATFDAALNVRAVSNGLGLTLP